MTYSESVLRLEHLTPADVAKLLRQHCVTEDAMDRDELNAFCPIDPQFGTRNARDVLNWLGY